MGSLLRPISLMLAVFGLLLIGEARGNVHNYTFVLREKNYTRICNTTSILTVNGKFPGPTITVRRGDTFYVNVHNKGSYGVTIHWHGVKNIRNPWSDGPENITQCPIQPGSNFTYMVVLSTEEGTLLWHAHNDWTRATVHGAIVILPQNNTYHKIKKPYRQRTIILASWYNGSARQIALAALANGTDPPASDGYTINGQPGDLYPCSNDSTFRMKVKYGKTYMLRIINAVVNEEQFFGIANHTMSMIGQDAAYVERFTTNYIMITPGQTMDVLVTFNQTPGYYYMASSPFSDANGAPYSNTTATAIIQYTGNNVTRPSSIPLPSLPNATDETAAYNFTARIKSLDSFGHPFELPKKINQRLLIAISINALTCDEASCGPNVTAAIAASMNNVSFETQSISILEAYYSNLIGVYDTDFPDNPPNPFNYTGNNTDLSIYAMRGTKVKMLNYEDGVEIVFQGTSLLSGGSHPIHVHGFSFYLVGKGFGNFNRTADSPNFNLDNPPLINTIGVPKNGWAAIRFVANNPGVWLIHCHYDKHALWGMDTVLIVKNGNTTNTTIRPPPPFGLPACSV